MIAGFAISLFRPGITILSLLGVIYYIASQRSLSEIFSVEDDALLKAFGLCLVAQCLMALRWASISACFGFVFSVRYYLSWTFAALFSKAFLSGVLTGDALRIIWLSIPNAHSNPDEHPKARRWRAGSAVRWDRLLGWLALLALGVPAWLGYHDYRRMLQNVPFTLSPTLLWILLLTSLGLVVFLLSDKNSPLGNLIQTNKDQAIRSARVLFQRPWRSSLHGLYSLAIHLLNCQALWMLSQGLGIKLGGAQAIGLYVLATLVALIPISLHGAGLREWACVSYFFAQGWDPVDGALLGLSFTGTQTLLAVTGSLSFYRIMTSFKALAAPRESDPIAHSTTSDPASLPDRPDEESSQANP